MPAEGYQLKSELARVCLTRTEANPQRALAWVNSICLLFVIVAWSGASSRLPLPRIVPPIEEPVPIIIQPIAPPPPQAQTVTKEETSDDKTPTARVVVVTPESPAINFSVPTIGNVLVPNAVAAPPPVAILKAAPPPAPKGPSSIGSTGEGGDRPQPPYPEMALKMGQQGTVVLLLTTDSSGVVQTVAIKETSGSPILDRNARDFVKRHWLLPAGGPDRLFQATIIYKISTN